MGIDDRFHQANNQTNTVHHFNTIGPMIVA
jgi:hypothetical protein